MAVARERLQPLRVADPLGRLLADEEVAAAPDDGEEVVVVGVIGGQRLDPEDEIVVRQRQPARVAGEGAGGGRLSQRRGGRSRYPASSIDAARRRNSSTTASRAFCSSGPMPSKLTPNRNPPRGAGRVQRTVAGRRTGTRLAAEPRLDGEGGAGRGRLGLGVDAPPALAEVGQEAGEPLVAEDVAAGRDERLDPLGLPLLLGSGHGRGRSLLEPTGLREWGPAPLRSRRRC